MDYVSGTDLNLAYIVRPSPGYSRGAAPEDGAPGLLMLHGRGADEWDLMGLQDALDPRLTIVSVRAPHRWGPGFAWYGAEDGAESDDVGLLASVEELATFAEQAPGAFSLDPERLYAFGFSQGAVVGAMLALTMPRVLRGMVFHSGYLPALSLSELPPKGLSGKGFFVGHGIYDDLVSVESGRAAAEVFREQGARVVYREYPIDHSIGEESLYELSEWLTNELDSHG